MINTLLHRQAVPLDSAAHRNLKVPMPVADWSVAAKLHSIFMAAVEFADACRDFPIVFVRAGTDPGGKPQIAPVAVFGLSAEENLFIQPDGQWRASYMPAVLRLYPFAIGRIDEQNFALCVDSAWSALSQGSGEALFNAQGEATEFTRQVVAQAEKTEEEVQRTRLVGERLMQLELLREMRFDVDLPDGQKLAVEGFFTVDEEKLKALPDATLLELARNGLLGLIQAHLISMANMRRLAEWRVQRGLQAPVYQAS